MKTLLTFILASSFMFSATSIVAKTTATVTVIVDGLRDQAGYVRFVLCTKDEDFPNQCKIQGSVKPNDSSVTIKIEDVPAGTYALAAFHDRNDNGKVDVMTSVKDDGLAFSNNAMGRYGPPTFEQSKFNISGDTSISVSTVYLSGK